MLSLHVNDTLMLGGRLQAEVFARRPEINTKVQTHQTCKQYLTVPVEQMNYTKSYLF